MTVLVKKVIDIIDMSIVVMVVISIAAVEVAMLAAEVMLIDISMVEVAISIDMVDILTISNFAKWDEERDGVIWNY